VSSKTKSGPAQKRNPRVFNSPIGTFAVCPECPAMIKLERLSAHRLKHQAFSSGTSTTVARVKKKRGTVATHPQGTDKRKKKRPSRLKAKGGGLARAKLPESGHPVQGGLPSLGKRR
jgi:hypothetical protein